MIHGLIWRRAAKSHFFRSPAIHLQQRHEYQENSFLPLPFFTHNCRENTLFEVRSFSKIIFKQVMLFIDLCVFLHEAWNHRAVVLSVWNLWDECKINQSHTRKSNRFSWMSRFTLAFSISAFVANRFYSLSKTACLNSSIAIKLYNSKIFCLFQSSMSYGNITTWTTRGI